MRARHRLVIVAAAAVLTAACGTGVAAPPTTATSVSSSSSPASSATVSSGPQVTVAPLPGGSATSASPTASSSPKPTAGSDTAGATGAPVTVTTTTSAPGGGSGNSPTTTVSEDPATVTKTVVVDPPSTAAPPKTTKSTTAQPTPKTTPKATGGSMTRKVVVIDPGHNGANGANPGIINQQVNAGFGQTKPCNTTGTETNAGYPEYKFNWNVALQLKAQLEAKGITVVMTRSSDDGVGPCVDKRAAIGNQADADAVVSIHGDGDDAAAHGFYVMTAGQTPDGIAAGVTAQSSRLAGDVRDGLAEVGLSPNSHLGENGLWTTRTDLAGLNLSLRPTVMIEAGNMRNAADAALMSSDAGQQQVAKGLAVGVVNYLIGR
jgi:N-acetylmuramoyl-L-alanine amidase